MIEQPPHFTSRTAPKVRRNVVSMKMKRGCLIAVVLGVVALGGLFLAPVLYLRTHPIAHQLPYKWDSYVRPDLHFSMEPMSNVIAKVNAVIREVSKGTVPEAIKLDTTPTRIVKVGSNASLDPYMDQLIADYRENENEMNRRGAEGFEGTLFTGDVDGHHSLWCTLVEPGNGGLHWEAKEDALHASRMPRILECRPYWVTDGLVERMKEQRKQGNYKVDAEPLVSALVYETDIYSWSIMVPDGPNSWHGHIRFDKVFKYVPEMKVILALTTPEEHTKAEQRLKQSGLWFKPEEDKSGHNQAPEDTTRKLADPRR